MRTASSTTFSVVLALATFGTGFLADGLISLYQVRPNTAWHTEYVENGPQGWQGVPSGKVYEVYVDPDYGTGISLCIFDTRATDGPLRDGLQVFHLISGGIAIESGWLPADLVYQAVFDDSGVLQNEYLGITTKPQGWILTEYEGIKATGGGLWVRWRDVTQIKGKGY
jgi:hypothetical protein